MADGSLYPATAAPARRPRLLGEAAPPPEVSDPFPVDLPPPPRAEAPRPPRVMRRPAPAPIRAPAPLIEHCRCCRCRGIAAPALPSLSDDAQSRMCFGLLLMIGTALYLYMAS